MPYAFNVFTGNFDYYQGTSLAVTTNLAFSDAETPSGTINGTNKVFTLANTPNPTGSLIVELNGSIQVAGGNDYTLSGNTVTFVSAPVNGSTLLVWYRYSGGTVSYADNETPSGTIDGSNTTFTLAHSPSPAASLILQLNGMVQAPGGVDYTLSGSTITFASAPVNGSTLQAWYRY